MASVFITTDTKYIYSRGLRLIFIYLPKPGGGLNSQKGYFNNIVQKLR